MVWRVQWGCNADFAEHRVSSNANHLASGLSQTAARTIARELDQETNFAAFSTWGARSPETAPKLKPTFTRPHRGLNRATLRAVLPPPGSAGRAHTRANSLLPRKAAKCRWIIASTPSGEIPHTQRSQPQTPGSVSEPSGCLSPLHSRPSPELEPASVGGCESPRPPDSL